MSHVVSLCPSSPILPRRCCAAAIRLLPNFARIFTRRMNPMLKHSPRRHPDCQRVPHRANRTHLNLPQHGRTTPISPELGVHWHVPTRASRHAVPLQIPRHDLFSESGNRFTSRFGRFDPFQVIRLLLLGKLDSISQPYRHLRSVLLGWPADRD